MVGAYEFIRGAIPGREKNTEKADKRRNGYKLVINE